MLAWSCMVAVPLNKANIQKKRFEVVKLKTGVQRKIVNVAIFRSSLQSDQDEKANLFRVDFIKKLLFLLLFRPGSQIYRKKVASTF